MANSPLTKDHLSHGRIVSASNDGSATFQDGYHQGPTVKGDSMTSNTMVGDARELDDQRQILAVELGEWRDAGAPNEGLVDAIEALIDAKIDHRLSHLAYPQRMADEGSLGKPTGTCPGTTRGNLGANSPAQRSLSDEQIKYMVSRFLGWRLPEHFHPDAGISFRPTFNEHMPFGPQYHNPTGTNLFDAEQAEAMVRYMIEGMPALSGASPSPDETSAEYAHGIEHYTQVIAHLTSALLKISVERDAEKCQKWAMQALGRAAAKADADPHT